MDEGLLLGMIKGNYHTSLSSLCRSDTLSFWAVLINGVETSVCQQAGFIKASAQKLAQFKERSLAQYDLVALFIDGKTFADQEMTIALGVTIQGDKIPFGFVQADTENERVPACRPTGQTGTRY